MEPVNKFFLGSVFGFVSVVNYLSDKLHNLCQVLFLLQNLLRLGTQRYKFREVLVVIFIQGAGVFAVADEPVDGWEVLPLSQLLIQTPEHLRGEKMGEIIKHI